jgi:GT2 family glycosyltransferase
VSRRPPVAVIVPFAGSDEQLSLCLAALGRLVVGPGDELIVADNRAASTEDWHAGSIRVIRANGVAAPGFARNRVAAVTTAEWLVFLDADTRPEPDLLERYFDPLPAPGTAILAGGIEDRAAGRSPAARHSARRGQMSHQTTLQRAGTPYAQSANLAVRRTAFAAAGGFHEGARAGEDADLGWRLRAGGWGLEQRPRACVAHVTRATLSSLLAQLARHGSGAAWLERRYPGEFPVPRRRDVARRVLGGLRRAVVAAVRGRPQAAEGALMDVLEGCAFEAGRRLLSNRPRKS